MTYQNNYAKANAIKLKINSCRSGYL